MNAQFGIPDASVEAKAQDGKYEELLSILNSRKETWYVGETGFKAGMHYVDMAALNRIHSIMSEAISPGALPETERTDYSAGLKKIMETPALGEHVKKHAREQLELLDIRMETPKKVRWLHGVGRVQVAFRIAYRENKAMQLIIGNERMAPRAMLH